MQRVVGPTQMGDRRPIARRGADACRLVSIGGALADVWHFKWVRSRRWRSRMVHALHSTQTREYRSPWTPDQRLVRLNQGEALFDVAKDPTRPMVVEVADKRVTAVGTEFSVRRDLDEITVLVKGAGQDRGRSTTCRWPSN